MAATTPGWWTISRGLPSAAPSTDLIFFTFTLSMRGTPSQTMACAPVHGRSCTTAHSLAASMDTTKTA